MCLNICSVHALSLLWKTNYLLFKSATFVVHLNGPCTDTLPVKDAHCGISVSLFRGTKVYGYITNRTIPWDTLYLLYLSSEATQGLLSSLKTTICLTKETDSPG
ncbi:hypothetical protein FKM82_030999 [Ascaphus truei]